LWRLGILLTAQSFSQGPPLAPSVFRDSTLDFRYTPPSNLYDLTEAGKQSIHERAKAMGKTSTLNLLLSLASGPDDKVSDWHSIAIQSYPREKMAGGLTDREASRFFSRTVAGVGSETGQPADVHIGDFDFVVSTFELHEGQLTKHARVYTTVRKGALLSFAFSANSLDALNRIVDSIKSVQPAKPN
jgi:hypothetical protein